MKKISLESFAGIIAKDESLKARLAACSDPGKAVETLKRIAAEAGYELVVPAVLTTLPDSELNAVTGGVNPFIPLNEGELNPYSWFVTFLRRLMGWGRGTEEEKK